MYFCFRVNVSFLFSYIFISISLIFFLSFSYFSFDSYCFFCLFTVLHCYMKCHYINVFATYFKCVVFPNLYLLYVSFVAFYFIFFLHVALLFISLLAINRETLPEFSIHKIRGTSRKKRFEGDSVET